MQTSVFFFIEDMEDDADALPQALEQFTETARAQISSRSVDTLLLAALGEIAARAESAILHNKYDRVRLIKMILYYNPWFFRIGPLITTSSNNR